MNKLYILQTEQNILNVIAAKHFDCNNIVIMKDRAFKSPFAEDGLTTYLRNEGFRTETHTFDPYDRNDLNELSQQLKKDDLFVVPNSRYAYTLNMVTLFRDKCRMAFVEEDGDIYLQEGEHFKEVVKDQVDLEVEDYIENFGGYIKHSSEVLFEEPCANTLFKKIIQHLNTYRTMLKPSPIKMNYDTGYVHVDMQRLNKSQKQLMTDLINIMVRYNVCALKEKSTHNTLIFYDDEYKDFIGKVGTWLEMATYKALSNFKDVDSPMSSVFFYWNRKVSSVSNEIDVMGTYDNRLVLISCKDTGNNLEKALYELFTHGEQLGFDKSFKVLVTTSELYPQLKQRAKELGIHLVRFDKDMRSLSVGLKQVLK